MAIKVTFKQGQAEAKATPLHQWDYGQVLEIESSDLPAVFEVHFACQGMNEAIVRSCSAVGGIGSVVIPDRCLEQSNQILAWVYAIQGAAGTTIKTITIPVVARTRPSRGDEIPSEISDVYTELVSEVNKAVDDLTNGNVTAANAKTATYATSAGTSVYSGDAERAAKAQTAAQADFAARAGVANTAATATNAEKATRANMLAVDIPFTPYDDSAPLEKGLYCILVGFGPDDVTRRVFTSIVYVNRTLGCDGFLGVYAQKGYGLHINREGKIELREIEPYVPADANLGVFTNTLVTSDVQYFISYRKIF